MDELIQHKFYCSVPSALWHLMTTSWARTHDHGHYYDCGGSRRKTPSDAYMQAKEVSARSSSTQYTCIDRKTWILSSFMFYVYRQSPSHVVQIPIPQLAWVLPEHLLAPYKYSKDLIHLIESSCCVSCLPNHPSNGVIHVCILIHTCMHICTADSEWELVSSKAHRTRMV